MAGLAGSVPSQAAPRERNTAVESDVERLEIAREHFQRGEALFALGQLEAAFVEYELAEVAHPSASVTEAKQRVRTVLEARHAQSVTPPQASARVEVAAPRARPLRRFAAPIALAPIAVAALVAGGALLAVANNDYGHLQGSCSPACAPSDVSPLRTRQNAGIALLAVGGVVAAADVALWAVLARRHEAPRPYALLPTLAAGSHAGVAGLEGRF